MTISELARAADVRISTLRFYERRGLLKPASRSRAGYRNFTEDDAARVRFLRRAQELGFSLDELGAMLALSRRRTIVRGDVARAGATKLQEIDERIVDLQRVRSALASLLEAQCIEPDAPCPIIAALGTRSPATMVAAPKPAGTRTRRVPSAAARAQPPSSVNARRPPEASRSKAASRRAGAR